MASAEEDARRNRSLLPQIQMTSTSHESTTENETMATPEEMDYESLPTTSIKIQLLAGAMAGIAEHTIVYPIDAIKVGLKYRLS